MFDFLSLTLMHFKRIDDGNKGDVSIMGGSDGYVPDFYSLG